MAQVAVNKDGSEVIGFRLFRATYFEEEDYNSIKLSDKTSGCFWCNPYNDSEWGLIDTSVPLPKGTIKKLIGRELSWEDEPVEI